MSAPQPSSPASGNPPGPPPYQRSANSPAPVIDTSQAIDLVAIRATGELFTPIQALEAIVLKYGRGELLTKFLAGWRNELRLGTLVEDSPGLFRFVKEHPENVLLRSERVRHVDDYPGLFLWDPSGRYF